MSDRDVEDALARSIERRVRRVDARVDTDELFTRLERRHRRQTRWVAAIVVALVAVAAGVGFLVGDRGSESASTVVAAADGVPDDVHQSTAMPRDVDAAVSEIIQAFHDAYDGGTSSKQRIAAMQEGAAVETLRLQVRQFALARGYTEAQLAGTTIAVSDVLFLDRTHALVTFTLSIPGHGAVITERVGYALFEDNRWKVALRTTCDLISLTGPSPQCPPANS
jgi:hypothetical protein